MVNRVWMHHFGEPWSRRPATSACAATRRRIPNCSITWRAVRRRRLVDQERCTAADHALAAPTSRRAMIAADCDAGRSRESAAMADEPPPLEFEAAARRAAGRRPDGSTRRSAAAPVDFRQPPTTPAAARSTASSTARTCRHVPHFDFASPDATHAQRLTHDGPAAGPVPDEQPVRRRAGPRSSPSGPRSRDCRRADRVDRLYRPLLGRAARDGRSRCWPPSSSTSRLAQEDSGTRLSPWQYCQLLLLTNERLYIGERSSEPLPPSREHGRASF